LTILSLSSVKNTLLLSLKPDISTFSISGWEHGSNSPVNSFRAIAIGKTTASFLPKDTNYKISPIQSIESCIKLAKNY
jgi:hypothetical protein